MGTLSDRIAAINAAAGVPLCRCGVRHRGAAWNADLGWHDPAPATTSPFVDKARAGTLKPKAMG